MDVLRVEVCQGRTIRREEKTPVSEALFNSRLTPNLTVLLGYASL